MRGETNHMATVEVIHFRLAAGADVDEFLREDENVGTNYTPRQPGFVSRVSARNDNGDWVVIVHWTNPQDAEESMKKFPDDPVAARFNALLDPETFSMIRYEVVRQD